MSQTERDRIARANVTEHTAPREAHGSQRRLGRWVVPTVLALAAIVWGAWRAPVEFARWRAAAQLDHYLRGDTAGALAALTEIARSVPDDVPIQARLMQWLADSGQASVALDVAERLKDADGRYPPAIAAARLTCLRRLGRHAEALDEFESLTSQAGISMDGSLAALNERAYLRALAGRQLIAAEGDMDYVLSMLDSMASQSSGLLIPARIRARLYAAIMLADAHEYAQAEQILDRAIDGLLERWNNLPSRLTGADDEPPELFAWLNPLHGLMERAAVDQYHQLADSLAATLTTRALVRQADQRLEESIVDRRRVELLGRRPEEILDQLVDARTAAMLAPELAAYLDTRACVYWRRDELALALADLNPAIDLQRSILALPWERRVPASEIQSDPRMLEDRYGAQLTKTLASLLSHRQRIQLQRGRERDAERDRQEIRRLGLDPDANWD